MSFDQFIEEPMLSGIPTQLSPSYLSSSELSGVSPFQHNLSLEEDVLLTSSITESAYLGQHGDSDTGNYLQSQELSPVKYGNYDYLSKRPHSNSLSLPIDQLNLLTLKQPLRSPTSQSSPSPPIHEERTINPRQLFNDSKLSASSSSPALSTLFQDYNSDFADERNTPNSNSLLSPVILGPGLNSSGNCLGTAGDEKRRFNSPVAHNRKPINHRHNSNSNAAYQQQQQQQKQQSQQKQQQHHQQQQQQKQQQHEQQQQQHHQQQQHQQQQRSMNRDVKIEPGNVSTQSKQRQQVGLAMSKASDAINLQNTPASSGDHSRRQSMADVTPRFDFIMNDECFNAIHYWLNNSEVNDAEHLQEVIGNPTGIMKNNRRRNSIHLGPPAFSSASSYVMKKKRRKSYNDEPLNMSVPVLKPSAHLPSQGKIVTSDVPMNSGVTRVTVPPLPSSTSISSVAPLPITSSSTGETSSSSSHSANNNSSVTSNSTMNTVGSGGVTPGNKNQHHSTSTINGASSIISNPSTSATPALPMRATLSSQASPVKKKIVEEEDESDEEKPFPCPECPKQFKRSEHLKRHIRSVHSNIRPFHCKYCEKKFSRSDNLAQHLKTHYKTLPNGNTTIVLGNPNMFNRGARKKT